MKFFLAVTLDEVGVMEEVKENLSSGKLCLVLVLPNNNIKNDP